MRSSHSAYSLVVPARRCRLAAPSDSRYQAAASCECVTPTFVRLPLFFFLFTTCKARKLHKYFIRGSILLCTDSMGKEINSGVLIMQRSDTDLILCLSTCTDILMHSVPATLWHTGGFFFTLFVQGLV